MKLHHAISEHLASLTREYHSLATTAETWTRHLASSCSSLRLDRDQWLMVSCMALLGVVLLFVFVGMVEVLTSRLDSVEREIEKIVSAGDLPASGSSSPRMPARRQYFFHPGGRRNPESRGSKDETHRQLQELLQQELSDSQDPQQVVQRQGSKGGSSQPLQRQGSRGGSSHMLQSGGSSHMLQRRASAGSRWISSVHGGGARPRRTSEFGEDSDVDANDGYQVNCKVGGADMVSDMGISGLCLVASQDNLYGVMCIACQAFFLQSVILFYIGVSLEPHPNFNKQKNLPDVIIVAAIYVHFLNCVRDIPRSMFTVRAFRKTFQDDSFFHTLTFGLIFTVDAFVTPLAQLFIGALFLCTSATVAEVIMNACAVAYISEIDNMILEVQNQMENLVNDDEEYPDVAIPVDTRFIRLIKWILVVVPVCPIAFSMTMGYVGLHVFRL